MIDGWSESSNHFFAVFACYPVKDKCKSLLLCFLPSLQEDDLSANSLQILIIRTLKLFEKALENVLFICGDNCNVNAKLSKDTSISLIGCASHRLNLAIQHYLQSHSEVLEKVDKLIKKYLRLNMQPDFANIPHSWQ